MLYRYTLVSLLACVAWLGAGLPLAALAADPAALDIGPGFAHAPVDHAWYAVLTEPSEQLGPREIAARTDFRPASRDNINPGFTAAQVWARFTLRWSDARTDSLALVLPKPLVDEVELIALSGAAIVERRLTGDALPFDSRQFGYRGFAFELAPRPGQTVTYLLRLRSPNSAIEVPLRLLETSAFRRTLARENFWLGGYFGGMTALAVAIGLLFLRLRQGLFLYYSLYIVAFTLMLAAVSGYGKLLLWPGAGGAQQYLPTVSITLAMLCGALFLDRFLGLARWPRWRWALAAVVISAMTGCLALAVGGSLGARIVVLAAVLLCPLVAVQSVLAMRAGDRYAVYFLAGWLLFVTGLVADVLDVFGITTYSQFSAYGLFVGALGLFATLTMGMAELVARTNRDREAQVARTNAELAELNQNLESIVRHRTRELEERNRELADLAIRDSLTGLYNHSASIELLGQMLHQSQRYDFPVAVVMVDIDHFKRINDSYGHQVGDALLERVAHTLVDSLRDSDMVGRYGGEEFLIAMPHADATAAREFGERLLARVRDIHVPQAQGEHLSVSLGISIYNPLGQRLAAADLIRRADEALYRSKREGRDRLTVDNLSVVSSQDDAPRRGVT